MLNLSERIATSALVFRGYNVTNLGRSGELLAQERYRPIVEAELAEASAVASHTLGYPVDLAARIRAGQETSLEVFGEAVALVIALEMAQLRLLRECHGVDYSSAALSFGYSLGEISALIAGGVLQMRHALPVLLAVSSDCAELGRDCTLAVLFSRGAAIDTAAVERLCLRVNLAGRGVIGVSAFLSPNSLLLNGQGGTVDHFQELMAESIGQKLHLRKNDHRWPPLHTPITWQRGVPNRAGALMHAMPAASAAPGPPVLSLVTGQCDYTDLTLRQTLMNWVDRPQRLWDAVYETCSRGIERVIHIGPEPNLIPATFTRLADNVRDMLDRRTWSGIGLRAMASAASRPWLAKVLPQRAALLRAPLIEHVVLEDWLLENA